MSHYPIKAQSMHIVDQECMHEMSHASYASHWCDNNLQKKLRKGTFIWLESDGYSLSWQEKHRGKTVKAAGSVRSAFREQRAMHAGAHLSFIQSGKPANGVVPSIFRMDGLKTQRHVHGDSKSSQVDNED